MEVRSSRRMRTLVTQMVQSRPVRQSERMRADIHDGPEQMLQPKAGYIDARPLTASSAKPLATHGRTIHWVKLRNTQPEQMSSALPPTADVGSARLKALHGSRSRSLPCFADPMLWNVDVRFAPKPNVPESRRLTHIGHRPTKERGARFRSSPSFGKIMIAVMCQSSYSMEMSLPV
jgi:hypothetical protein